MTTPHRFVSFDLLATPVAVLDAQGRADAAAADAAAPSLSLIAAACADREALLVVGGRATANLKFKSSLRAAGSIRLMARICELVEFAEASTR